MKKFAFSFCLALLLSQAAVAQSVVDVPVEARIISPLAMAELNVVKPAKFGTITRSRTKGCDFELLYGDLLWFETTRGGAPSTRQAPAFNADGCGALNDRVQQPLISYTCPLETHVTLRTEKVFFGEGDWVRLDYLSPTPGYTTNFFPFRSVASVDALNFDTVCRTPTVAGATITVEFVAQTDLHLEPGVQADEQNITVNVPLEIVY